MRIYLKFVLAILFISFFVAPSFALLTKPGEIKNRELPENYTAILIQLPSIIHQPIVWNEKFAIPTKNIVLASYQTAEEKITELSGKSVDEVASIYNSEVFLNNPDYSYAYVKVPNEKYEEMTETFRLLGFDVKNVSWGRIMLDESRQEISLPYNRPDTGQDITGNGVQIAILDTGLDPTHQDFFDAGGNRPINNKVIFWDDVVLGTQCCQDQNGHGTHVASIAAGTGVNSSGVYRGIAPNAQLLIFRISQFGDATLGDLATAVNGAVNNNADVISLSFGWTHEDLMTKYNTGLADACIGIGTNDVVNAFNAIQNAIANGIPVVVAAGNEGPAPNTIDFPACINGVIAVGMTFKRDYTSNYHSSLTDLGSTVSRSLIHVNADASGESLDEEWYAINITSGEGFTEPWRYYTWSGFTKVFNTANPTLNLKIEGQYKNKQCWPGGETIFWNPGNSNKDDKFWTWQNSVAPFGGMEVFGKVHTNWGWCLLQLDNWGTTYINSLQCSGTPKSCNDFDGDRNNCGNQAGCYWCGCGYTIEGILSTCYPDKPQADCHGCTGKDIEKCYVWFGCHGTPKSCGERNSDVECGTPSTTGCSGQWVFDDLIVRPFSTTRTSLRGLPTPESSRGPSANGLTKPDVTAPGFDVCAARAAGTTIGDLNCINNNYVRASGTSMATPAVAGFIALLREINPVATFNEIVNSVRYGSDILINYVGETSENHRGSGRINVSRAADSITDCSVRFSDGWYCDGNVRKYRDYYFDINTRECTFAVTQSENCDNYDGWYCNGNTREYRDYYCSAGSCAYSVAQSQNCGNDGGYADTFLPQCSGYNYISYTSANQMRDYYCSGGNCGSAVNYDSYITNVCTSGKCENYDNPVLYYKFDEGTGTTVHDSSGNARNGTTNAVWVDGHREKALNFTGLDYVKVPYNLNNISNLSIEAWVKMNPYSEPRYFIIASKTGEEWNAPDIDYDYKYTITPVASSIRFSYRYSGGKCSKGYTKNITDGRWHHIAVTLDSTNNKIVFYTDGVKDYETSGCGTINLTSYNTRAGQMIGLMDELKIYNKVIDYESPITYNSSNIVVDVDVKNTGTNQQAWWFASVEFWKVNDYNDPWNTRSMRVNAYYNGKNRTHGCTIDAGGYCPTGVDCYLISDPNGNGYLDVGETIRVRCQIPASYYGLTTGNQRIMFWVHERDLGQDAGNNGNAGNDWWWDALSWANHADLRVKIECRTDAYDSDGGMSYLSLGTCTDYYQDGSTCKNTQYTDACIDSNILREYYVSGLGCANVTKSCSDYGSLYVCSAGRCKYNGGGGGGGCLVEGTKILTPNGFKNIEDIKVGDMVIGYKDGKRIETKVTRKVIHFGFWDIYYYKGSWFTETHKIYPSLEGEATIVSMLSNTKKQYSGTVYDVETGTHNYFGENDLLIHNMFMKT
jgi:subtilisin family serine protease